MTDLAARLEAATEGSRELSDAVLMALGWTVSYQGCKWWLDDGVSDAVLGWDHEPDPTCSVDDALALVPNDWWWTVGDCRREAHATIGPEVVTDGQDEAIEGFAATPALALSAALVRS